MAYTYKSGIIDNDETPIITMGRSGFGRSFKIRISGDINFVIKPSFMGFIIVENKNKTGTVLRGMFLEYEGKKYSVDKEPMGEFFRGRTTEIPILCDSSPIGLISKEGGVFVIKNSNGENFKIFVIYMALIAEVLKILPKAISNVPRKIRLISDIFIIAGILVFAIFPDKYAGGIYGGVVFTAALIVIGLFLRFSPRFRK
jgi:hypothetical protein